MKELKTSITESLDGFQDEIYPFIPFILQDLREIGADPAVMLKLLKDNIKEMNLKVLDLGCGKGAVSVIMAKELGFNITGIDAMPEFIKSAGEFAKEYDVEELCNFEVNDIRIRVCELKDFDIVILGAIGPVLGNLFETLTLLRKPLDNNGYILLDDGFIEDESSVDYNRCLRKTEFYKQIKAAGYEIIEEIIMDEDNIAESDKFIYDAIEKRVNELVLQYPDKKEIFLNYLKSQENENYIIENELTCGTWLLRIQEK